jgi:hypothetical protein
MIINILNKKDQGSAPSAKPAVFVEAIVTKSRLVGLDKTCAPQDR